MQWINQYDLTEDDSAVCRKTEDEVFLTLASTYRKWQNPIVRLSGCPQRHLRSLEQIMQTDQTKTHNFNRKSFLSFFPLSTIFLPSFLSSCEDYSVLRVLFPFSFACSDGIGSILESILTAFASYTQERLVLSKVGGSVRASRHRPPWLPRRICSCTL